MKINFNEDNKFKWLITCDTDDEKEYLHTNINDIKDLAEKFRFEIVDDSTRNLFLQILESSYNKWNSWRLPKELFIIE